METVKINALYVDHEPKSVASFFPIQDEEIEQHEYFLHYDGLENSWNLLLL